MVSEKSEVKGVVVQISGLTLSEPKRGVDTGKILQQKMTVRDVSK